MASITTTRPRTYRTPTENKALVNRLLVKSAATLVIIGVVMFAGSFSLRLEGSTAAATNVVDVTENKSGKPTNAIVDVIVDDNTYRVSAGWRTQVGDPVTVYNHDGNYTEDSSTTFSETIQIGGLVVACLGMFCGLAFLVRTKDD